MKFVENMNLISKEDIERRFLTPKTINHVKETVIIDIYVAAS